MPGMDMGAAAGLAAWTPAYWLLVLGMWWTMMIAMMAPAAAPMVLLYVRVQRHATAGSGATAAEGATAGPQAPVTAFALGYCLAWLLFSVAATVAQHGLQQSGLLAPGTLRLPRGGLAAMVLVAAGLYQWSPVKGACLAHCRSPAGFLSRHWRPGARGAMRLGALHGSYCLGCCWVLMALLFVGGVMNPWWIVALSLLVVAEKYLPHGALLARAGGVVLVAWGIGAFLVGFLMQSS